MRLLKLILKNFKGIKNFILDTQGGNGNVSIYGDNSTGKTTLADSFAWLLFDKDSSNRKDFGIKTLDNTGQPLHNIDHEVEAVLEIEGKTITLRKVYAEKWTKKRGNAKATFTGHTTDYFIDGVPVKKGEYEARIAEIADENIFKLLTNPSYFNEQLHWQERRKILLEVCGDISDEEVIASDKSLSKLPQILQGHSLDDYRKIITAKRAEINKELDKIPVRIDEATRALPDLTGIATHSLASDIEALKLQISNKNSEIARIESGGEVAEKIKKLREIEAELIQIQSQHRSKYQNEIVEKQKLLGQSQDRYLSLENSIWGMKKTIELNIGMLGTLKPKMSLLRQKWHELNDQQFEFEQDDTCPTCGQILPEEKLAEAREKALAAFNLEKAERLEANSTEGKRLKAQADDLQAEIAETEKKIDQAKKDLAQEQAASDCLRKKIESLRQAADDYAGSDVYIQKQQEADALKEVISNLKTGSTEAREVIIADINSLEFALETLEETQAKVKQHDAGQKRIEELEEQEHTLAAEFEKLEGELYLCDQFVRSKVNLLEERINSRFRYARFKMFEEQVNGGLQETCLTTYQGVPYSDLNHGSKINVGLDVLNTLSKHYGFSAPIWLDNREAITKVIPVQGQLISLVVSESDKSLRVEIEGIAEKNERMAI